MKKIFLLLFLAYQINAMPIDTSIYTYLPLQVGNTWLYHFSSGSPVGSSTGFDRYTITGTIVANGHQYFTYLHSHIIISGIDGWGCNVNPFSSTYPVRLDSLNYNIYVLHSCNSNPETFIDSLNSKLHDTSFICPTPIDTHYNKIFCIDTGTVNLFGSSMSSKDFYIQGFEGYDEKRFVKSIGISYTHFTLHMSGCTVTLTGCVINGTLYGDTNIILGINQISSEIPNSFSLLQNYPNPFNPSTNIKFQIAKSTNAKLIIYDALGKEIETLIDKKLEPGEYQADFDGTNLPSGVYFYKLVAGDFTETKKMVLIK